MQNSPNLCLQVTQFKMSVDSGFKIYFLPFINRMFFLNMKFQPILMLDVSLTSYITLKLLALGLVMEGNS